MLQDIKIEPKKVEIIDLPSLEPIMDPVVKPVRKIIEKFWTLFQKIICKVKHKEDEMGCSPSQFLSKLIY